MSPSTNPLLAPWDGPYGLPPFAAIRPEHYEPAVRQAMASQLAELDMLASQSAPADFANTALAFDRGGALLQRIALLFSNVVAAETSPALQEAERVVAPLLAGHEAAVYQHAGAFARIDDLHRRRLELGLDAEQLRLVERLHLDFCLAGAQLPEASRQRAGQIAQELSTLTTQFTQNVLADESSYELSLQPEDLAGLPDSVVSSTAQAAADRGKAGQHIVTLSRSVVVPFLTSSPRRDLRQKAWQAWVQRGQLSPERDNLKIAQQILGLRHELAALHGLANYADFALRDTMAQRPSAVSELLLRVWGPAVQKALREAEMLQAQAQALGEPTELEPWDWRYLAEKVRSSQFAVDDSEVKPFFALEPMIQAAFDCANQLFGLTFVEQPQVQLYHPDTRLFEVHKAGQLIGLFISDNFARPSKRGGAWMNEYRYQSRAGEAVLPVVGNHNNFAKPAPGQPSLLSLDDVRTLFHEFGHGLHGLLSNATYARLAGTRVLRDFVELPSQLFEHWCLDPQVLGKHARHVQTGQAISPAQVDKLLAARRFYQGVETVEYTSSALLDMALHSRADAGQLDIAAFEQAELQRLGMPYGIAPRHRPAHFLHLFSGPEYAAGYYVYMWAEVLEADGFEAFVEAGDVFDPAVAERLYRNVYSAGNTLEPGEAYRRFRGRDPEIAAMIRKRGLG
jgi:peptidyl-dipeptidase Dcp